MVSFTVLRDQGSKNNNINLKIERDTELRTGNVELLARIHFELRSETVVYLTSLAGLGIDFMARKSNDVCNHKSS